MSEPGPLVSVVLPVYEEGALLATTVAAVVAALGEERREVILVDDGSADATWETIRALAAADATVRGLRFSKNFGHQRALLAGLAAARGAAVITLDSDGQHPPELIGELLARWRGGAKVVQGLRADVDHESWFKRLTSRAFYRAFGLLAGGQVPAGSADYRLLDRAVVDVLLGAPRMGLFLRGFVPWTGVAAAHVPFTPRRRAAGRTKYSLRKMLKLAEEGVVRFSVAPLRCSTLLGVITSAFALAYLAYVIYVRAFGDGVVPGWASVTGLVALLGGMQLLVLGVLGEYVGTMFQAVMNRPDWIVIERVNEP